jgi:hypothetical protein
MKAELAVLRRKPDEMPQVFANKLKEFFSKANPISAKSEMERTCFRKIHEKQIIKLFIQKINNCKHLLPCVRIEPTTSRL